MTELYDLILTEIGEDETSIALAIINHKKKHTRISSRFQTNHEAKLAAILKRLKKLPTILFQHIQQDEAEELCKLFQSLGARVEIKPARLFFSNVPEVDRSTNYRYSSILQNLEEPLLTEWVHQWSIVKAYRFIYTPWFHYDTVIRIWQYGDNYSLVAKSAISTEELPDTIGQDILISLPLAKWIYTTGVIHKNHIWTVQPPNRIGGDGANWVIEAYANGQYRMIDEWSP